MEIIDNYKIPKSADNIFGSSITLKPDILMGNFQKKYSQKKDIPNIINYSFREKNKIELPGMSLHAEQNILINSIKNLYVLENSQKIFKFLKDNNDLMRILKLAPYYIKNVLGSCPLYLELHNDPEENWDELFIIIKTPLGPENALEKEKKLFDIWFSNIINKVGNRLNYAVEPL